VVLEFLNIRQMFWGRLQGAVVAEISFLLFT